MKTTRASIQEPKSMNRGGKPTILCQKKRNQRRKQLSKTRNTQSPDSTENLACRGGNVQLKFRGIEKKRQRGGGKRRKEKLVEVGRSGKANKTTLPLGRERRKGKSYVEKKAERKGARRSRSPS